MGEAEHRREAGRYELVIRYDVLTHEFSFEGWEKSRMIALGMLEFAKTKLLRVDARMDLMAEAQNAPRIVPGGVSPMRGPLSQ